jgi:hypothetical protein
MNAPRRVGAGYRLAQFGALGVALGGVFDLFVPRLLPHHYAFMGATVGEVPDQTAALILLMLHVLGVALAGVGVAGLALLSVWRRTGDRAAAIAAAVTVGGVAAANAYGVYAVGAILFIGPLLCACFVVLGVWFALRWAGGEPQ